MLSITKLQNLKAIHNSNGRCPKFHLVVINHKTTKFESNSQHLMQCWTRWICCYQSQNYKIWKQFTTYKHITRAWNPLLSITKLQNLKAIHNLSKSDWAVAHVVINHKTTKFESNSQQRDTTYDFSGSCYQSQNYKIWKQFTTSCLVRGPSSWLLSITKLQNLKAIHNYLMLPTTISCVVINHKTTKFESNSQPQ